MAEMLAKTGWIDEAGFAAPLLAPDRSEPSILCAHHRGAVTKRYAVYRNNVTHGLIEALGANFPRVRELAGAERFNHVALLYLRAFPPRSKLVFEYGETFADFLDDFAPARHQMPWLADLARLERAWLDAWHAADLAPLDPQALARIAPESLGDLMFLRHPAAQVIISQFAIFDLREGKPDTDPHDPQAVLVTRPDLTVETRHIDIELAGFIAALLNGQALAEAARESLDRNPGFDVGAALALLVASGATSGLAGTGNEAEENVT